MKREKVLTQSVSKLYNTIGPEDILREEKGQMIVGDKILSQDEKKLLMSEATQFLATRLWKVLQADVKYQANKKMYLESKSLDDMVFGKMWTYTLDAIRTRLESLSKGSGHFNSKNLSNP